MLAGAVAGDELATSPLIKSASGGGEGDTSGAGEIGVCTVLTRDTIHTHIECR